MQNNKDAFFMFKVKSSELFTILEDIVAHGEPLTLVSVDPGSSILAVEVDIGNGKRLNYWVIGTLYSPGAGYFNAREMLASMRKISPHATHVTLAVSEVTGILTYTNGENSEEISVPSFHRCEQVKEPGEIKSQATLVGFVPHLEAAKTPLKLTAPEMFNHFYLQSDGQSWLFRSYGMESYVESSGAGQGSAFNVALPKSAICLLRSCLPKQLETLKLRLSEDRAVFMWSDGPMARGLTTSYIQDPKHPDISEHLGVQSERITASVDAEQFKGLKGFTKDLNISYGIFLVEENKVVVEFENSEYPLDGGGFGEGFEVALSMNLLGNLNLPAKGAIEISFYSATGLVGFSNPEQLPGFTHYLMPVSLHPLPSQGLEMPLESAE